MIITDNRITKEPLKFAQLISGETYIDYYGKYVLATGNVDIVIDLVSGDVYQDGPHYANVKDAFTPVNAKLEIY